MLLCVAVMNALRGFQMDQNNIFLETVIKGLECCTQHGSMCGRDCNGHWGWTDGSHTGMELLGEYRTKCTYGNCKTGCVKTLTKDALALLKDLNKKLDETQRAYESALMAQYERPKGY